MSQTTKKALAASLKALAAEKPLDKITIVDIAEDCGVNRQTFYYHFQDIYDLVDWVFESESTRAIGGDRTYETWQNGFLRVFQYVLDNRAFVQCVYRSVCRENLERFLYHETYQLLMDVVEEVSHDHPAREEDKAFTAHFYKYGLVGLVLDWIDRGMKDDPQAIIDRLSTLIHGNIAAALDRFQHG